MDNSVLPKFNTILEEFIIKMVNAFPNEPKIKSYYQAFKISKMYDDTIPIKLFMGGCLDYSDQIKNRNSDFFLNKKTFVDKCVRASSFSDDFGLKNQWENTSETTKKAIWDYVQTLFVLGEMYISKNSNSIEEINTVYNSMSYSELKRFENEDTNELSNEFKSKLKKE
jgi:hypothetical protein